MMCTVFDNYISVSQLFNQNTIMKNTNIGASKNKTTPHHNDRRPDIRDDMDSRSNEEYDIKGDNVTNNRKETKEEKLKNKK